MYFGKLAQEYEIEVWLVNFSMFEIEPYRDYLEYFSFIAARDPITFNRLSNLGIETRLTFDCSCLSFDAPANRMQTDHRIALIRGRNVEAFKPWFGHFDTLKYDCAWQWLRKKGTPSWLIFRILKSMGFDIPVGILPIDLANCIEQLSKHRFSMTTSYHANIFSFLAGIYFLAKGLGTGIVALHQLAITRDTLWLRMLGRGKVQIQAINELKALPINYPHRESILELVYGLLETLEGNKIQSGKIEKDDQELIMSLRTIFQEKLAQEKEQGIQQGIQQEINLLLRQLKRKIGDVSPKDEVKLRNLPIEKLEDLGEALLDFNSRQDLISWLNNH